MGIPIGPDTSLIFSEAILAVVDAALAAKVSNLNGFRFADDYEFGVTTYGEAEEILAILQEELKVFELTLNFQKTKIVELPLPLDSPWVNQLRAFEFRSPQKSQAYDILHYIDAAIDLSRQYPSDFVLKYAVARLRGVSVNPANWPMIEEFLLQCLMVEPGTFLPVLERLIGADKKNYQINLSALERVLNTQVATHARAGRASEVAWALWGLIYWFIPLDQPAAQAASSMEDSIVALLTLDAENRGLVPSGLNRSLWGSYMTQADLYGRHWLLAYEAQVKGWLSTVGGSDHVAADPAFGFFKANGVEFYDSNRLITFQPVPMSGAGFITPMYSPI